MNKILAGFLKASYAVSKQIVPQIAAVEAVVVGIKRGPDRKQAVIDGIMIAPEIAELINGKEIVNEGLFKEGVAEINDGYVKVMNSFKKAA